MSLASKIDRSFPEAAIIAAQAGLPMTRRQSSNTTVVVLYLTAESVDMDNAERTSARPPRITRRDK